MAHTNLFNATDNGQALWKDLSFAQLGDAADRCPALQPAFSHINTDDPDLRGLRRAGGKVLSYHGLNDDLIAPQGSLNYYARVVAEMGGHEKVQRFSRLYLIPGMAHDGSGDPKGGGALCVPVRA